MISEKMLQVCLADYWRKHELDGEPLKEATRMLSAYLNDNLDKKQMLEIDNLASAKASAAEEQGFINGFQYAIQFFGVLKGGVVA